MAKGLRRAVKKIRTLVEDPELVAQNRRRLLDAATNLFRANGFHNTSTRDIALETGISVGSMYQYILKKEDLVVLILSSVVEIYQKTIYPLAEAKGSAKDRLWQVVSVYYRTLDEHHAKTDLLYHNFSGFELSTKNFLRDTEERVNEIVKTILDQGVADGEFAPVNTLFVAHSIVSMGHMWALKRGRFRNRMTIADYVAEQQKLLERLLCPGTPAAAEAAFVPPARTGGVSRKTASFPARRSVATIRGKA